MTAPPMPILDQQRAAIARREWNEDVLPERLLLRLAAASCAMGAVLTGAVLHDWTARLDQALFDFVHAGTTWTPLTAPHWWNEGVRDITALGGTTVLTGAVFASCLYLVAAQRYRLVGLLLGSALAATLFSALVKMAVSRMRPQRVEHMVATTSASFPSGHALLSAAIILTIGGLMAFAARRPAERKVIMATALVVTGSVGLSRIWLGVHWPSDVLAGWMFGMACAAITLWLAKQIDRQGASVPGGSPSAGVMPRDTVTAQAVAANPDRNNPPSVPSAVG